MKDMSKVLETGLEKLVKEMPVAKGNETLAAEFISMVEKCDCSESTDTMEKACKLCQKDFNLIMDSLEQEQEVA